MTALRVLLLTLVVSVSASDGYHPSVDMGVLNNLAEKYNVYIRKLGDGIVDLDAKREVVKAWKKARLDE